MTVMIPAETMGKTPASRCATGVRCITRPARTTIKPMTTSNEASPMLKATSSNNPNSTLWSAIALSNTTRADGQGTIPPLTPRASKFRNVILSGIS